MQRRRRAFRSAGRARHVVDLPRCATLQEEEFQGKWRLMKQGKNKPLEADEVEFLDSVVAQEMETEKRKREEETQELQSFQARLCAILQA